MPTRLEAVTGDITAQAVDAIVNAANEALARGGGVCGAIFAAAGPGLAGACAEVGGCPTGDARATPGFDLPARWVIHAVGPVWRGGRAGEAGLLASCYRRALEEAVRVGARSVAFPAISTGIFGYPVGAAAHVAVTTVAGAVHSTSSPLELVRFVCFDAATLERYRNELAAIDAEA